MKSNRLWLLVFGLLVQQSILGRAAALVSIPTDRLDGWDVFANAGRLECVEEASNSWLKLSYDLDRHDFVSVQRELGNPLSSGFQLHLNIKGEGPPNSVELKLHDAGGNVYWRVWPDVRLRPQWRSVTLTPGDFSFAWGPEPNRPMGAIVKMEWGVSRTGGGPGWLALDDLFVESAERKGSMPAVKARASTEVAGLPAEAAIDGNAKTRWGSEASDPQWLELDLGKSTTVTGIIIQWEAAFASGYEILAAIETGQWNTVYQTTEGRGGVDDISFSPRRARYLRIVCQRRGTAFGYSVFEVDIKTAKEPWGRRQPRDFFAPVDWFFSTEPRPGRTDGMMQAHPGNPSTIRAGLSWQRQGFAGYAGEAAYFNSFFIPPSWDGADSFVRITDVQDSYTLYVNGHEVAGGEAPPRVQTVRVADYLRYGAENDLVLLVTGDGERDGLLGSMLLAKSAKAFAESMETLRREHPREYVRLSARLAPRGYYPFWLTDQQGYWTVVGVERDQKESLFAEDGAVEPYKSFSISPFLRVGEQLITREDVDRTQTLEQGYLPLPRVQWAASNIVMDVDAFTWGAEGASVTYVSYNIQNSSAQAITGSLCLAIRPYEVNPPWQWGGFSRIDNLSVASNGVIAVNEYRIIPCLGKARFGVASLRDGDVVNRIARGRFPVRQQIHHPDGLASGVMRYPFKLAPGSNETFSIALPLYPGAQEGRDIAKARRACVEYWSNRLAGVRIQGSNKIRNTFLANLAYILINRDGPAIQPGSRAYEASWIRDGAVTAKALLRCGFTNEVREYIEWYSQYLYEDGRVPAIVIHNRNEVNPVKEYDSQGEFIDVIHSYWQYTGDEQLVREQWTHITRALRYLEQIRDSEVQDFYLQHDDQRRYHGLLPKSVSHEGYYPEPGNHSYWDDFWGLKGWKDAIELADAIGATNERPWMVREERELREAVYTSLTNTMHFYNIDYLPGCAELGDFDAPSSAGAMMLCDELAYLPGDAVTNTLRRYCHEALARRDPGWTGSFTPYEIRIVPALRRLGWHEEADEITAMLLEHQHPPGWQQWPEAVYAPADHPGYIGDMPHTWISAGFINTILTEQGVP